MVWSVDKDFEQAVTVTEAVRMTKLMQWLSLLMVFAAVWLSLITDSVPISLSSSAKEVIFAVSQVTDKWTMHCNLCKVNVRISF